MLVVLVLYNVRLSESTAYRTITNALSSCPSARHGISLLLYDNTPEVRDAGSLPTGILYESAGRNAGLAAAYNRALEVAEFHGAHWLLLLDQDTALPGDFLESLLKELSRYESCPSVVALVPVICCDGAVVSPKKVDFWGLSSLPADSFGIQDMEIMSINSGTAIRCSFVRSIGGFNTEYWLDYLDHWLFRQIYAAGKKVVVWECSLEHRLSVQNYRQNIRMERYRSILAGEARFMTTHKSVFQVFFYVFRLLVRSIRMVLQKQFDLAAFTLVTTAKIILHPRRLAEYESR